MTWTSTSGRWAAKARRAWGRKREPMVRLAPHGQLAHLVPVAQLPVQVLEQAGDPLAMGLEPPALLGEHQPPAHPVKQGHAVVGLQLPDGGADGGLGRGGAAGRPWWRCTRRRTPLERCECGEWSWKCLPLYEFCYDSDSIL